MHDRDPHANILGISAPWQFSDVVLDIATGTVEAFVEHHGEASCPKSAASSAETATPWSKPDSRFRDPHAIRLIRWIRACIDAATSCGRSITTASRSAVKCEPSSAHGVVARTGLAALRTARLAAALDEGLDRAGRDVEDHVGELPWCGDPEDVGVEVAIVHVAKARAGRTATRDVGVG